MTLTTVIPLSYCKKQENNQQGGGNQASIKKVVVGGQGEKEKNNKVQEEEWNSSCTKNTYLVPHGDPQPIQQPQEH